MKIFVVTLFSICLFASCTPLTDIPTAEIDNKSLNVPTMGQRNLHGNDIAFDSYYEKSEKSIGDYLEGISRASIIQATGKIEIIEGKHNCTHTLFHVEGDKTYELIEIPEKVELWTGNLATVMAERILSLEEDCVEALSLRVIHIERYD